MEEEYYGECFNCDVETEIVVHEESEPPSISINFDVDNTLTWEDAGGNHIIPGFPTVTIQLN